jgi:hypothetical protein
MHSYGYLPVQCLVEPACCLRRLRWEVGILIPNHRFVIGGWRAAATRGSRSRTVRCLLGCADWDLPSHSSYPPCPPLTLPAHNAYGAGTPGGGAQLEWSGRSLRSSSFPVSPASGPAHETRRGKARKERENTGKLWNSLPNVHADRLTARTGQLQCLQQRLCIIAEVLLK